MTYLKKQADIAHQEMTEVKNENKMKRMPKYLQKSPIETIDELEEHEDLTI